MHGPLFTYAAEIYQSLLTAREPEEELEPLSVLMDADSSYRVSEDLYAAGNFGSGLFLICLK